MALPVESKEEISARVTGNSYALRGRLVSDTLRRIAIQNPGKLGKACLKLYTKAIKGDVQAFRELADRIEGKVPQALTGSDGGPIQFQRVELVVVDMGDVSNADDAEIVMPAVIPAETKPEITDKFSALAHSVRIERSALSPLEQAKHATATRKAARGRAKLKNPDV